MPGLTKRRQHPCTGSVSSKHRRSRVSPVRYLANPTSLISIPRLCTIPVPGNTARPYASRGNWHRGHSRITEDVEISHREAARGIRFRLFILPIRSTS
jgi:hypothetical protein